MTVTSKWSKTERRALDFLLARHSPSEICAKVKRGPKRKAGRRRVTPKEYVELNAAMIWQTTRLLVDCGLARSFEDAFDKQAQRLKGPLLGKTHPGRAMLKKLYYQHEQFLNEEPGRRKRFEAEAALIAQEYRGASLRPLTI
jgi:hypothetical protein